MLVDSTDIIDDLGGTESCTRVSIDWRRTLKYNAIKCVIYKPGGHTVYVCMADGTQDNYNLIYIAPSSQILSKLPSSKHCI